MKNIIVIYDDRQRPGDDIREITGDKSFGSVIYKRKTLKDIFGENVLNSLEKDRLSGEIRYWSSITKTPEIDGDKHSAVVLVFSDCVVKDLTEFSVILRKAGYCGDDYCVPAGDRVAAAIFSDTESFYREASLSRDSADLRERASEFDEIASAAFLDISGREEFLGFITGGFEARFFNSLSGDRYTVVKKSSNAAKIRAEYRFYYFLPESMRSWFVLPYEYREEAGQASYKMQRYHMTDLAIRYVHGAISPAEFEGILDTVFVFLNSRSEKEVSWNEFYEKRRELYIEKVEKRIGELKQHPAFPKLEEYISCGTACSGIDGVLKRYEDIYDRMIGNNKDRLVKTVSHGDLCFSNILYSPDSKMIRFIDPRGADTQDEIYSDPLYDIAKLSHSVTGQYDFINSGLYGIELDEDMLFKLKIDGSVKEYREIFEKKLKVNGIDINSVRLFECSLFLSMLPLHMDRPRKVAAFILKALEILDEICTPQG